jgi:hypothetical protein
LAALTLIEQQLLLHGAQQALLLFMSTARAPFAGLQLTLS